MKNNIINVLRFGAFFLCTASLSGCKVTEPDNLTFLDDQEIYTNITKIRNVLNTVYSGLPDGYTNIGASWLAAACDEAEEVNNIETIQNFNIGNITPYANPDGIWDKSYISIRNAQVFLQSTDTLTWLDYKYANPDEYTRRLALTKQYRAEARFLLAFFYFELIKRYGGVPIVDEVIDRNEDWTSRFPRSPFAACVDFIAAACDAAYEDLPATYDTGNYGRATKGAALALKARLLLYAASDLYNQPGNTDPLLGYTDGNREERWIKAAEASKAVLDFTPQYSFNSTYQGLFTLGSGKSNEVIFERRYPSSNTFEKQHTAIGFPQGLTGTCPSGNLLDAYEQLEDGEFDWNNPAHAAQPFANRDPRLQKSIVVNNSSFGPSKTKVEIWAGGVNGKPRDRATKTGYYLRKYMIESLDLQLNQTATKQWVFFRLAEVYLNYAEAMNEAYGPEQAGTDQLDITALSALNMVRTRAAVGLSPVVSGLSQQALQERIRRERRVELAFEGHRFFDARRWMIGAEAIGGVLKGVDITKGTDGSFSYRPITVETRSWDDKLYYYPVPQAEINKSTGIIVQNKGW